MIRIQTQPLVLVLWEKKDLPERAKNSASGEWEKTGKMTEYTVYTFRDQFGDVMKFMSIENKYRTFEGDEVIVTLGVKFDDYNNVNKLSLEGVDPNPNA